MPFVKGQSGNPGGRVGVPEEVRELGRTPWQPDAQRRRELVISVFVPRRSAQITRADVARVDRAASS